MAYRKMLFENSILLCLLTTARAINLKAGVEFPISRTHERTDKLYVLLLCY
jgi:hypothetical protein